MSVLLLLIFASMTVAAVFLGGFIWAVRSGQYDDTSTPSLRVLADDAGAESANFPSHPVAVPRVLPAAEVPPGRGAGAANPLFKPIQS